MTPGYHSGRRSITDYYLAPDSPYAASDQEHLSGGGLGLKMFRASQQKNEFIDPPVDDFMVVGIAEASASCAFDFGDGWIHYERIHPGSFGLQPARQECHFRIPGPHSVLVAAIPNPVVIDKLDQMGLRDNPYMPLYSTLDPDPTVFGTLERLWRGLKADASANTLLLDGLSLFLLGYLLKVARSGHFLRPPLRLDDRRLARVVNYIETYHASSVAMADLAAVAAISTAHFPRAFRKASGRSPHAYLTGRRIEHAKRMLRTTDLPVTQIAFATGFGSPSHFATVFRNHMGRSPSAFRKSVGV